VILRDLGQEFAGWDAVMQLARECSPRSYLEIGVRYGDSLLRVLTVSRPERLAIADAWTVDYFGPSGSGTQFDQSHAHVERMLQALDYRGKVTWLDGDSHKTLPTVQEKFDLVLLDRDRPTAEVTRQCLEDSWRLVAPNGWLVYDDYWQNEMLRKSFDDFFREQSDVAEILTRNDKKHGVAVARKQRA